MQIILKQNRKKKQCWLKTKNISVNQNFHKH